MSSSAQQILDQICAVMPSASFDPPATNGMLDSAERSLGVSFPDWLRRIYLACNGFRGPTELQYIYPLDGENGVTEFTLFLRDEWQLPWLSRSIVFADNGGSGSTTVHWCILDGDLIEWCYGHNGEYSVVDGDIFALLAREQVLWDEIESDAP